MSVPMALVDMIPVVLFLWASIILQRDLYNKMSKGAFALFAAGTITVFVAGLYKAVWKLLAGANICDFVALNKAFFPMQATGFVLAGVGIVALLVHPQGKGAAYCSALPLLALTAMVPEYTSSMPFVVLMVLGVAAMDGGLGVIAARRKQPLAVALLVVSFLFVMGMGYLSSKDFEKPVMNWIAECVNIVGQGTLLLAALHLHKTGLGDAEKL